MLPCMVGSPFLQETPSLTTRVQSPWTLAEESSLLGLAIEALPSFPRVSVFRLGPSLRASGRFSPLSLSQLLFPPCDMLFLPLLPTSHMQILTRS